MMNPRELGRYLLDLGNDNRIRPLLQAGSISYANWWAMQPEEYWLTRFVRHYYPEEAEAGARPIRFCSVFGPKNTMEQPCEGIKIFYSGENLEEFERFPGFPSERCRMPSGMPESANSMTTASAQRSCPWAFPGGGYGRA